MSAPKTPNFEEGKLIRDIDFRIMICKEKIRNHQESIKKIKKMSGMNGPLGIGAIDYSGIPRAGFSHMDFPDALMSIAKAEEAIEKERESIRELRRRRRNLISAADRLEGAEQSIFVYRVIYGMTQDAAADAIGMSRRQLQRTEKKMRNGADIFRL